MVPPLLLEFRSRGMEWGYTGEQRTSGPEKTKYLRPISSSQCAPQGVGCRGRRGEWWYTGVEYGRKLSRSSASYWHSVVIYTPFLRPVFFAWLRGHLVATLCERWHRTERPDTAKRCGGRECWHRRGQQTKAKGLDGASSSLLSLPEGSLCPPALGESLPALLPSAPVQDRHSSPALRLLAARTTRHQQFYLLLLSQRGLLGPVLTWSLAFPESALSCVLSRWSLIPSRHL